MKSVSTLIGEECRAISKFLQEKNKGYGNSFANPVRVFSKASALEGLNIRLDDKLSRLVRGDKTCLPTEDTELDFVGYIILKRVLKRMEMEKNAKHSST